MIKYYCRIVFPFSVLLSRADKETAFQCSVFMSAANERILSMKNNSVFIEHWSYTKPNLIPNKNGNIVIIQKVSFGPLEMYEWGIDSNNIPYTCYQWLENDFFQYENYKINITKEELFHQIYFVISLFQQNKLSEWADIYNNILDTLNSRL